MDFDINDNHGKLTIQDEVESKGNDNFIGLSGKKKLAEERAIARGFNSNAEYQGWLYFNRLENPQYEGYSVDILHYCDGASYE